MNLRPDSVNTDWLAQEETNSNICTHKQTETMSYYSDTLDRKRGILVEFYSATNTKPARIKLQCTRYNKRKFITFKHDESMIDTAAEYLSSIGIECDGVVLTDHTGDKYTLTTIYFATPLT